jgi:hypothetical protein
MWNESKKQTQEKMHAEAFALEAIVPLQAAWKTQARRGVYAAHKS